MVFRIKREERNLEKVKSLLFFLCPLNGTGIGEFSGGEKGEFLLLWNFREGDTMKERYLFDLLAPVKRPKVTAPSGKK